MTQFYVQSQSHALHWFYRCALVLLATWMSLPAFASAEAGKIDTPQNDDCLLEVNIGSITHNCEGTATVCLKITGGLAPYIITLDMLNLSAELTVGAEICFENLRPGDYVFKVKDLLGCTKTVSCTVPENQDFEARIKNVTCHSGMDGAIDLEVPIDVAPIYYRWSGPNGFSANTEDIKNLKAGVYHVRVFGANNICYGSGKFEVKQPEPIKINIAISQAMCGNAKVCAFINGGTGPYKIWGFNSLPPGVNDNNFTHRIDFDDLDPETAHNYNPTNTNTPFCKEDIESGSYYVIVKDAKGCFGWKIFRVNNNSSFKQNITVRHSTCAGANNGKICFDIVGGTAPYKTKLTMPYGNQQYVMEGAWGCFENLAAGEYIVTTTDATGCTATERVRINQSTEIQAEFFLTSNNCRDGASGCLKVSGGTEPYRIYAWRHPNPGTNAGFTIDFWDNGVPYVVGAERAPECEFPDNHDANGLYCARNIPVGVYIVLVVDKNNCYKAVIVVIPPLGGLEAEFEITSNVCDEQVNGCLKVFGGMRPYRIFVWRHRNGEVTDYPDPDWGFDDDGNPYMNGNDWQSTNDFEFDAESPTVGLLTPYKRCARNIPPGFYAIVVVDKNGCHTLLKVRIPRPNPLKAKFEITSQSCNSGVSGCLFVEGGTRPYHIYVWRWNSPLTVIPNVILTPNGRPRLTGGNGEETDWSWNTDPSSDEPFKRCAENIRPGKYFILVVDKNHCYKLIPVLIPETPGLWLETRVDHISCNGENDGRIKLQIEGGEAPYTIYFNENETDSELSDDLTIIFDELSAGIYIIKVVDKNGCEAKVRVEVKEPEPLRAEFELDENTNCDGATGGCLWVKGGTRPYRFQVWRWEEPGDVLPDVEIDVETGVVSIEGAVQTDLTLTPPASNSDRFCIRNVPPSDYLILVKDANGCFTLVHVEIPPYEGLTVTTETIDPACNSEIGGSIILNISGGEAPYKIRFNGETVSTSENIYSFENVAPGTYIIRIWDSNECEFKIEVAINEPGIHPNLEFAALGDSICVYPTGGTEPYVIEWMDLQEGEVISTDSCVYDLSAGVYMVTINDDAGCSVQKIVIIDPQPCEGGRAKVRPGVISSGDMVTFILEDYIGDSIQWQFKTEFTGWIDLPGANSDAYVTPMLLTGSNKTIQVRAKVICADGTIVFSTETSFKIRGDYRFSNIDARIEDPNLFNPRFRRAEARALGILPTEIVNYTTVYPTVSRDRVQIRFDAASQSQVRITALNELGSPVHQSQLDQVSEGETTSLSVNNWQPGMYFIRVETGGTTEIKRIVVK